MNILLIGNGGREHALAWKIAQSKKLKKLYIATGNAGTSEIGINLNIDTSNFLEIKQKILELAINLVIVGPEVPLVEGIRDFFENETEIKHIPLIGPSEQGAMLEGSKEFAKKFMQKYQIPTAAYQSFTIKNLTEGYDFLETLNAPYVLKADGLAAGKGVLIIEKLQEAKDALKEMLEGQFGQASEKVVIEEFLSGTEVSYFVLTDGKNYKLLPEAKDYKRIGENNTGLNTGGMGAISPVPFVDKHFTKKVIDRIIAPTIKGLQEEKINYQGFIFFGLIEVNMEPYVIEYNVRLGDPEAEVILPRIKSDLLDLMLSIPPQELHLKDCEISEQTATSIMLVSGGYPNAYEKNKKITGFEKVKDSLIFHAGTKISENQILTNGGRVLAITALGKNKEDALKKCYENIEKINFEGKYYRKDIGFDL